MIRRGSVDLSGSSSSTSSSDDENNLATSNITDNAPNIPPPPPISSIVAVKLPKTLIESLENSTLTGTALPISRYGDNTSIVGWNCVNQDNNIQVVSRSEFKEPTYDQIKPVIGIPIPNANTDLTNELMKGWITKYDYDNVPPEALMEIFKFVDISTLSNCSLVSKNWHFATLHDALWEESVRKLFTSFNSQEADYYVIDCGRMNKKYGTPIKPPPKLRRIEDYVTIQNGKIISYHTLRALNIEQGKKKLVSKLKRDRKEYWRDLFQEKYDNVSS